MRLDFLFYAGVLVCACCMELLTVCWYQVVAVENSLLPHVQLFVLYLPTPL